MFSANRALFGRIAERVIMPERWLAGDEIATHLGVNPDTIYKWITRKSLPMHKLGPLRKFLAIQMDDRVKGCHAAEDGGNELKRSARRRKPTAT